MDATNGIVVLGHLDPPRGIYLQRILIERESETSSDIHTYQSLRRLITRLNDLHTTNGFIKRYCSIKYLRMKSSRPPIESTEVKILESSEGAVFTNKLQSSVGRSH